MAKKIMIQGAASGVGKTILATALCRIFTQDGIKTAPYKSQNITAAHHTLPDGRKMARSQAIAAYACNAEPDADMNPILLIMGSEKTEVAIDGKTTGIMGVREYSEYKKQAFAHALAAFDRLSQTNDIIVIEGAGSPVELNLNQNDIVNMGLAKTVNAPVVLIADIIRGGVFASLYGTMALLPEDEKQLVKGFVVNKLKGNTNQFKDGVRILEDLCGIPSLGVIPYTDVRLEDEDSLSDGEIKTQGSLQIGPGPENYNDLMRSELDRIAAHFRANLDMKKIYEILDASAG